MTEPPLTPLERPVKLSARNRLHISTLFLPFLTTLAGLAIPALIALVAGFGAALLFPLAVMAMLSVLFNAIRYFTLTYHLKDDALVIEEGLLEKKRRHIPFDRVQNVRREQKFLHRLFSVCDLEIETAGSSGAEASLSLIGLREAERLRSVILRAEKEKTLSGTDGSTTENEERDDSPPHLVSLPLLILAGLTSHIVTTVLALLGLLPFLSGRFAFLEDIVNTPFRPLEGMREMAGGELPVVLEFFLSDHVGKVLLLILLGLLGSVIRYVVMWYGFRLDSKNERFTLNYGLLARHSGGIPKARIQVLKVEEPLLRRCLSLASMKVDTAGDQAMQSEDKTGRGVLLPVLKQARINEIARAVFDNLPPEDEIRWQRVSPLAVRRGTIKGAVLLSIVAAQLVVAMGWSGLWIFAALPVVWFLNHKSYQHTGYWINEDFFAYRRGWLSRSTRYIPQRRIQLAVVRQNPFDRRLGLASLVIDTAGQTHTGGIPPVRHLPLHTAETLMEQMSGRENTREDAISPGGY